MDLDDRRLLAAHAAGEPGAFDELVRRHTGRMWAVALATCADREDAADALQDALVKVHRSAGGFRGDSAVTTWLHRIVVNSGRDVLRRKAVRPTVALPEGYDPAAPGDAVAAGIDSLVVHDALERLPADQRVALVLVDLHGVSIAEAAELLGAAQGTIKSRCARGRARLAVLLGALDHRSGAGGEGTAPGSGASQPATPPSPQDRSTSPGGAQ